MLFSLAACSGSNTPSSSGDSADGSKNLSISVILKTTASEYWRYVVAGAEAYGTENSNVKVDVKGDFDEQQNIIETDLNSGAYDAYRSRSSIWTPALMHRRFSPS